MSERLSMARFQDGAPQWRLVFGGACTHFAVDSFAAAVALVEVIGRAAVGYALAPDIDLHADGVTVRLATSPGGLSAAHLELAQQISRAAAELGRSGQPGQVQTVQIAIDAVDPSLVMPFWRAVLGYDLLGDDDLVDPRRRGPAFWLQQIDAPRSERNTMHVDVCVPIEQAEARVAAALAAGGRVVRDEAPQWWTLADPEGNEVDVASMAGRA